MVFSSTTFLFIFFPVVLIFYWLPDVCSKIKSIIWIKKYSIGSKKDKTNSAVGFCYDVYDSLDKKIESDNIPQKQVLQKNTQPFRTYKNLILLVFSILFYARGEPAFVLVMILSTTTNYTFGRLIDKYRNKDKLFLWLAVLFNLGILFIFKYLCFTLNNIGWLINKDFSYIKIALPIGISFFTFQAMSYVIDVYKKKVDVQKNLFNIGLYISLFPQLIAGPIVRYETIEKEIENREETFDDFSDGTFRFIQGITKKVLIADNMAIIADCAFETNVLDLSMSMAWIGAIAYTLQIYFDFSGYSDMAIGLGRMFGFHFLENFNYPYMASSITDFWRRWHISLSSWFRDYVYFPLGGSRVNSKARHIFNLFVVWLLTGIWHGANWTFLVWGLLYLFLLVVEKQTGLDKKKAWWGHIYTMFFVIITWVIFRAENLTHAFYYLKTMFLGYENMVLPKNISMITFIALATACAFSLPIHELRIFKILNTKYEKTITFVNTLAVIILFVLTAIFICSSSYSPFIYFNF